jgi:uncharacterized protein (AIM24 family)
MLFGQQGFFVDRFNASQGDAVLWPHAHGNVFEVNLATGEVIPVDVEPRIVDLPAEQRRL